MNHGDYYDVVHRDNIQEYVTARTRQYSHDSFRRENGSMLVRFSLEVK